MLTTIVMQLKIRYLRTLEDYRHEKRLVNIHWVNQCILLSSILPVDEKYAVKL